MRRDAEAAAESKAAVTRTAEGSAAEGSTTAGDAARTAMRDLSLLWTQSHGVVLSYIRSIITDLHQADDVLQETAATIAEKFSEYDRSREFAPWALGIAKNKIREALRRSSHDRLVFSDEVVVALADACAALQPRASDAQHALEHCVSRVQGRSRKLLEMRYLRQQSVGEVASKTGMTPAAVRVALFRIRKVLMQCIDQQLAVLGVRTTRPAGGPARSSQ